MGFSAWSLGLALRVIWLGAVAALLGLVLIDGPLYATCLLVGCALLMSFGELARYAGAADRDLARIIEALSQGDLTDRLPFGPGHRRDRALSAAFGAALDRLRARHAAIEAERQQLRAVIDHAPVPLLTVRDDGRVELLNRAAHRLFDGVALGRAAALIDLAPDLGPVLASPVPRRLVLRLSLPRGDQRCLASIARSVTAEGGAALVSLQNIQTELEASETRAWEDLVRVLAHEIMNSLTPVASLAQTATLLVDDLGQGPAAGDAALGDLAEAVDAIGRRSNGLMRFVAGYRSFAEPPVPVLRRITVASLFERARVLVAGSLAESGTGLTVSVIPAGLSLDGDADLLDQVLLNLLKNSIEAMAGQGDARIELVAVIDPRGRVAITLADNGPGLPVSAAEQIFVPFFTTKAKGSGIGLSLVRQIMLAHGGAIEALAPERGAAFRLTFRG